MAEEKEIPRRDNLDLNTAPEKLIYHSMLEVERLGNDPKLEKAMDLLQEAKDLVADFIDNK